MKRFVDLRGQKTGYRFAFWDTVTDRFDEWNGIQAFDTWDEFLSWYSGNEIKRYRGLCPDWAFVIEEEEE